MCMLTIYARTCCVRPRSLRNETRRSWKFSSAGIRFFTNTSVEGGAFMLASSNSKGDYQSSICAT